MERLKQLARFNGNYLADGLRLALLNALLAGLSGGSFVGTLLVVTAINHHYLAQNSRSRELAFPYRVLFILYVLGFLVSWIWCGRRLPGKANTKTAVVGAAPLLLLALLGVAATVRAVVMCERDPSFPLATCFVYGLLSAMILLAGLTSILVIHLAGRGSMARGFDVIPLQPVL
jgi:hypothetical protein